MNPQRPNTTQHTQLSNNEKIVNRTNLRRRRNRRKKIIFRSVLGLIFFCIGTILALTLFFNVNSIVISGDKVYSDEEIIEVAEVAEGDNLIFLSKKKINEKVTSGLAYVGEVKIKRRLPSTLEIEIIKTDGYMAFMSGGYYTLLDKNGKVLEKSLETVGENIILVNLGDVESANIGETIVLKNTKVFDKMNSLVEECESLNFTDITNIDLSDIHNIKVVYQGRITLELGETQKDTLGSKLALGQAAIAKQDEENDQYCGTINLTVEGKGYWSEDVLTTEPETEESTTETQGEEETTVKNSDKEETTKSE